MAVKIVLTREHCQNVARPRAVVYCGAHVLDFAIRVHGQQLVSEDISLA